MNLLVMFRIEEVCWKLKGVLLLPGRMVFYGVWNFFVSFRLKFSSADELILQLRHSPKIYIKCTHPTNLNTNANTLFTKKKKISSRIYNVSRNDFLFQLSNRVEEWCTLCTFQPKWFLVRTIACYFDLSPN